MVKFLEKIASDPYVRRVMEEREFMTMNIDFWKQTIVNKDSIIAQRDSLIATVVAERDMAWDTIAQKDNDLAQKDYDLEAVSAERDDARNTLAQRDKVIEEYMRRYGKLNGVS